MTSATKPRKSLAPWIYDEIDYYDYQVDGVRWCAKRKSFILGDDMGLGKSIQALTAFAVDVARGWYDKCIVIAPVTLKANWQDEIIKFTTFPHILLEGSPKQRNKQLLDFAAMEGPKILITNYEQIIAHLPTLDRMNFDIAIFDEAHFLKNPKSKRTQACLRLHTQRSFMLTGTPLLNHVNELWTLLHRCDPKRFPRYWSFVNRYCVFGGYENKSIIGVKNEAELNAILEEYMLRRVKSEVLDLPEVQTIERKVDLAPEQRKLYSEVLNDMKLTRFNSSDPDDIDNALTKFLRLKQICGTTFPFTGDDISTKLDVAVADALELMDNKHRVIVFTQFRDVADCYESRIAGLGFPVYKLTGDVSKTLRQPMISEWSQTAIPGVIICMIQVAGIGLNMVSSRHIQFVDKLFVPGLNQQAIDRAHRIGQDKTQPVQVWDYKCRNTIESRVDQILATKKKIFGDVVESDPAWKRKLMEALMEDEAA